MRTLFVATALAVAVPAAADSIHDNYHHSTAVTISLTAPTRATTSNASEGTLAVRQSGRDVSFTWSDDGIVCTLSGKVSGYAIRFYAGQSCRIDDDDSDASFKLSLVAGSGTVDEDGNLALAMEWRIRGTLGGQAVSGAANQRTNAVPF